MTKCTHTKSTCSDLEGTFRKLRCCRAELLSRTVPTELRMSSSMYEVFHWNDAGEDATGGAKSQPLTPQGTPRRRGCGGKAPRDSSPTLSLPPPTPTSSFARHPMPQYSQSLSSSPIKHHGPSFPPSAGVPSTALTQPSNSTSVANASSSTNSRFSVWEFGDNFLALGPAGEPLQPGTPQQLPRFQSISLAAPPPTSTSTQEQQRHPVARYVVRKAVPYKGETLLPSISSQLFFLHAKTCHPPLCLPANWLPHFTSHLLCWRT